MKPSESGYFFGLETCTNPALKSIYKGRSLRENYSALNPDDVLYETAIGALLGNVGGVNVMRTVGSAPGSDLSLHRSDFLYHAAMDDRVRGFGSTAIENSYLLPYSDTYNTPTSAMSISSTDAMQDWIVEQYIAEIEKAKAADASERARYKELERKFLDGTITQEEGEELWRLEGTGKFGTSSETEKNTPASEYARYKELERKFVDGNINEKEWKELIRSEDIRAEYEESRTPDVFKKKEVETFNDSSIMLSGGVLDEFDRKSTWMEYNEDIAWVNPNYSTNKFEWQYNCQRCVSAYEMRRKGFDVTAKPLPTESLEEDFLAQRAECEWKDAIRRWCMKGNGKEQVEAFMRNWGDGARAIVGIGFKGRFGHVFIAEQRNGRTIYIDPQTGSADCSSYFENALKDQTYIVRIDALTPTNVIFDCCKNRR